jgi:hypothetical protein
VVALALTLLLGFAALVVDVGLSWAVRVEAQTAAAALAGASRLAAGPTAAVAAVCASTWTPTCRAWPTGRPTPARHVSTS